MDHVNKESLDVMMSYGCHYCLCETEGQPYDVMKSKMAGSEKFKAKIGVSQIQFCFTQESHCFSTEIWNKTVFLCV